MKIATKLPATLPFDNLHSPWIPILLWFSSGLPGLQSHHVTSLIIATDTRIRKKQLLKYFQTRWFYGEYMDTQITSRVSCQKGTIRHAYAWQIGPSWQDTLDLSPYPCSNQSKHLRKYDTSVKSFLVGWYIAQLQIENGPWPKMKHIYCNAYLIGDWCKVLD